MTTDISCSELSHAYIVVSPEAEQRQRTVQELCCSFLCDRGEKFPCMECRQCRMVLRGVHPDVIFVDRLVDDKGKQKATLLVDQIRHMAADAWAGPQQAEKKVYVIPEAGLMNEAAQNAALKILEEPPAYCSFVLCTDNDERLLPTVRSRCVLLRPAGEMQHMDSPLANEYIGLVRDATCAELCAFFARCESLSSDELKQMIEAIRFRIWEMLSMRRPEDGISRDELMRLVGLCDRAHEYLRMNVGAKHVLGLLCVLTK